MDHAAFHVVYVDKRASEDLDGQYVQRPAVEPPSSAGSRQAEPPKDRISELLLREIEDVRHNLRSILSTFDGGKCCCTSPTEAPFACERLTISSPYMHLWPILHGQAYTARCC